MFGIKQKRLVKNAAKLAARSCSYLSSSRGCDCKYINEGTADNEIKSGGEHGSGCPELTMLACLVAAMTEQEFNAITKRAGIMITDDSEPIDAENILDEEKKKHKEYMEKTLLFSSYTPRNNVKQKSAYDLNNAKDSIKKALKSK